MEFKGKKPEKIIKQFCDIHGTIDGLGKSRAEKESKQFFENLRKMEHAYNGKSDFVFTTLSPDLMAKTYFNRLQCKFDDANMKDRVSSCLHRDNIFDTASIYISPKKHVAKIHMIGDYAAQEKDKNNVAFCLYAGDSKVDRQMALAQNEGKYYENIPGAFIDTKQYKNSFTFANGKVKHFKCKEEEQYLSNFAALSKGYEYLTDLVKTKNLQTEKRTTEDSKVIIHEI